MLLLKLPQGIVGQIYLLCLIKDGPAYLKLKEKIKEAVELLSFALEEFEQLL